MANVQEFLSRRQQRGSIPVKVVGYPAQRQQTLAIPPPQQHRAKFQENPAVNPKDRSENRGYETFDTDAEATDDTMTVSLGGRDQHIVPWDITHESHKENENAKLGRAMVWMQPAGQSAMSPSTVDVEDMQVSLEGGASTTTYEEGVDQGRLRPDLQHELDGHTYAEHYRRGSGEDGDVENIRSNVSRLVSGQLRMRTDSTKDYELWTKKARTNASKVPDETIDEIRYERLQQPSESSSSGRFSNLGAPDGEGI